MTGVVKRYFEDKGFGFIAPDGNPKGEVFVHVRSVRFGKLAKGERVEYEVGADKEGRKRAVEVRVLD
jgi:cold shock CspA family protein